jgi:Holliday junction resolvasome RuvABC DNA-binding subunit
VPPGLGGVLLLKAALEAMTMETLAVTITPEEAKALVKVLRAGLKEAERAMAITTMEARITTMERIMAAKVTATTATETTEAAATAAEQR